tara:strand:+ start:319 stop:561 length:243 start_codon:yes stop_codon:yes gene_type:complete
LKFEVFVTLKKEVLDPQGKAIENALKNIGFRNIETVRQGKYFSITIDEENINKAEQIVNSACKKLLSNETIEEYKFKLIK